MVAKMMSFYTFPLIKEHKSNHINDTTTSTSIKLLLPLPLHRRYHIPTFKLSKTCGKMCGIFNSRWYRTMICLMMVLAHHSFYAYAVEVESDSDIVARKDSSSTGVRGTIYRANQEYDKGDITNIEDAEEEMSGTVVSESESREHATNSLRKKNTRIGTSASVERKLKKNSHDSSSIDSSGRKRRRQHDHQPKESLEAKAKGTKVSYYEASDYEPSDYDYDYDYEPSDYDDEAPLRLRGKSSKSMVSSGDCYTEAELNSMATKPSYKMSSSDSLGDFIDRIIDNEDIQDRFAQATESLFRQVTGETRRVRGLGGFVWSIFAAPVAAIRGDDVGAVETGVDGIAGVAGPIIGGVIGGPVGAAIGGIISNTLGGVVSGIINWFCRRNVRYEVHIFNLSSRDIEFVSNVANNCNTVTCSLCQVHGRFGSDSGDQTDRINVHHVSRREPHIGNFMIPRATTYHRKQRDTSDPDDPNDPQYVLGAFDAVLRIRNPAVQAAWDLQQVGGGKRWTISFRFPPNILFGEHRLLVRENPDWDPIPFRTRPSCMGANYGPFRRSNQRVQRRVGRENRPDSGTSGCSAAWFESWEVLVIMLGDDNCT